MRAIPWIGFVSMLTLPWVLVFYLILAYPWFFPWDHSTPHERRTVRSRGAIQFHHLVFPEKCLSFEAEGYCSNPDHWKIQMSDSWYGLDHESLTQLEFDLRKERNIYEWFLRGSWGEKDPPYLVITDYRVIVQAPDSLPLPLLNQVSLILDRLLIMEISIPGEKF